MNNFYKRYEAWILLIGVIGSVIVFAFTTFATQKSLDEFKGDVKESIREIKEDGKEIKADIKLLLQKE